jgi:hypothetical protein
MFLRVQMSSHQVQVSKCDPLRSIVLYKYMPSDERTIHGTVGVDWLRKVLAACETPAQMTPSACCRIEFGAETRQTGRSRRSR